MSILFQTTKKLSIIIDVDGTLGDNVYTNKDKNLKYELEKENPDLFTDERKAEEFNNTKPFENSNHIINELFHKFKVILITGRAERFRAITNFWLGRYGYLYHQLFMIENDWDEYEVYLRFKLQHISTIKPILVIDDDLELIRQTTLKFPNIQTYHITRETDWDSSIINSIIGKALLLIGDE